VICSRAQGERSFARNAVARSHLSNRRIAPSRAPRSLATSRPTAWASSGGP